MAKGLASAEETRPNRRWRERRGALLRLPHVRVDDATWSPAVKTWPQMVSLSIVELCRLSNHLIASFTTPEFNPVGHLRGNATSLANRPT